MRIAKGEGMTDWQIILSECKNRNDVILIIDAFVEESPNRAYGFAHIVLDDYNLGADSIEFCRRFFSDGDYVTSRIEDIRYQYIPDTAACSEAIIHFMREQVAVWDFLTALAAVPESVREDDIPF